MCVLASFFYSLVEITKSLSTRAKNRKWKWKQKTTFENSSAASHFSLAQNLCFFVIASYIALESVMKSEMWLNEWAAWFRWTEEDILELNRRRKTSLFFLCFRSSSPVAFGLRVGGLLAVLLTFGAFSCVYAVSIVDLFCFFFSITIIIYPSTLDETFFFFIFPNNIPIASLHWQWNILMIKLSLLPKAGRVVTTQATKKRYEI